MVSSKRVSVQPLNRSLWGAVFAILLLASRAFAQISFNASVSACGNVDITGGFTLAGHQDVAPTWDWGDGQKTRSFFPVHYQYLADGTYTITGSVIVDGAAAISSSQRIAVSGAQAPGCDSAIYVDPPKAVLKSAVTSLQLATYRVSNSGQIKPADPTALVFTSSSPARVQVSKSGLISAKGFGNADVSVLDPETGSRSVVNVFAGELQIEPPYARLHLTANPTIDLKLAGKNADGTALELAGSNVQFTNSIPARGAGPVISITPDGKVRAIRILSDLAEMPIVTATVNGVTANNNVPIRVVDGFPDIPYVDLRDGDTRFHIASQIGRWNNEAILKDLNAPHWTDRANSYLRDLAGFLTDRGGELQFVNDVGGKPGRGDPTVGCGQNGNPTRLGASPDDVLDASCLIAANASSQPAWFIYFHEKGHDHTGQSRKFQVLVDALRGSTFQGVFAEGLASSAAIYQGEVLRRRRAEIGLSQSVIDSMATNQTFANSPRWVDALSGYVANGARFPSLTNPDIFDGMLASLMNEFGLPWYVRFHSLFLAPGTDFPFSVQGETQAITTIVAGTSAAARVDLRARFAAWGFPIDNACYERIMPQVRRLTAQRQPLLVAEGILNGASYSAAASGVVAPSTWMTLFGGGFTTRSSKASGVTWEGASVTVNDSTGQP